MVVRFQDAVVGRRLWAGDACALALSCTEEFPPEIE
jgi:hypothetical protein